VALKKYNDGYSLSCNTAYTPWTYVPALRDIVLFSRSIVYAENIMHRA